jgi:hypothetical protein
MYLPNEFSSPDPADSNYLLINPRNEKFVAGKGRYQPLPPFWRVASWILLLYVIVYWVYLGGLPAVRSILYLTTSISTMATIEKLEAITDSKKSSAFYVTYRWRGTANFWDEKSIPEDLYKRWHVGDAISIRYVPTFPDISAPTDDYVFGRWLVFDLAAGVVFFLPVGIVLRKVYLPTWRSIHILNHTELIETNQVKEFRRLMRVKARKWLPIK